MIVTLLACVGVTVCVWVGWWTLLRPCPPPTHVTLPYVRPSVFYPLKVLVFYCLVQLRKRREVGAAGAAGYGARSYSKVEEMERPQQLHPEPKAIDAVFFSGTNSKGWGVVAAMERRPNSLTSTLLYVKVPGVGLLVRPSHPDTVTFRRVQDEDYFCAGGLTITPKTPMSTWHIHYKGKLRKYVCENTTDCTSKPADTREGECEDIECELVLSWLSELPHYDYDTDLPTFTIARAFATEPWTKQFFSNLRKHHQTHYEQMGQLQGTITLDSHTHTIYLPSFRDHSYGREREWRLMHRYVFHHIFMEDGSKGVVGVVCQPSTCSRLEMGHWWGAHSEGCGVTSVDLELQYHGENGTPPSNYAFIFTAGGVDRLVEVEMELSPQHYLGWDWEARMRETFVRYRIDGVSGSGICEWHYRNTSGRPPHLNSTDPQDMKDYRHQYLAAGTQC